MGKTLATWVIHHRAWVLIVTLIFVAASGSGVQFLEFNDDTRYWFSDKNPNLRAFETLEDKYTKNENVYFAIEARDGTVFTRKTLAAIEELTDKAWQLPFVNRVDSLTNFQHTSARGDEFIVRNLVEDAAHLSNQALTNIKAIALAETTLINRLLSPAGGITAINANVIRPSASGDELARITQAARLLVDEIQGRHPQLKIYLSGAIPFDNALIEATRDDIKTLSPIMVLIMLVITGALLRSVTGTTVTVLLIGLSSFTAIGLAGWFGIPLNPASGAAPTVIMTLAIADSIHILMTFLQRLRSGTEKDQAIIIAMDVNLRPVFLTSVTTAIGFLSMNFSDAPPFHDLGNIVAMGVTIAFVLSVTFLPAMISLLPLKQSTTQGVERLQYPNLSRLVSQRSGGIIVTTTLASVLFAVGIYRIELDDNFIDYLDERYEIRRASDFIQSRLTGFDAIDYSLDSGQPGGVQQPEYLKTIEAFANWYKQQPGIVHVSGISTIFKRLNKNMHGDDENYYRIPRRSDLAAQYLLLYEMSLPYGLDLNNRIDVDKSASRFTVIIRGYTSKQLRELDTRAQAWLKVNAPASMHTHGSGLSLMFAHISKNNIETMLFASLLALILISITIMVALRSFKYGALSLLPNMMPAFMAFGIWGVIFEKLGLAASVIVALTLGIVVDDTVHFLSNYLHARRERGFSPTKAVEHTFNTVGTALWSTTLILVSGFVMLTFSGYKVNEEMGMLTAITISLALILDFLFLPALLVFTEKRRVGPVKFV
ncbi:MAG: MMPL family transporter [Gammaproteobacteria bacterium]|nr:MAG: MMPL family transporter [Gammaproteobacteria bacterium]